VTDRPDETPSSPLPPASLRNIGSALALGLAGGATFFWLSLPLPWMLGAMAATSVAAISGMSLAMSKHLRHLMIAVIGVLLGSAFTPELAGQIALWTASLTILAVFLVLLAVLVPWCLRHAGYDRATAFFSALPAGLTEMTAIGSDNGGNPQTIALTHTVRVLIVAFVIPFLMVVLAGYERPTAAGRTMIDVSGADLSVLAACCVIGLWLGLKFKFPAGALAGPLILSALVHVTGLTSSSPPDFLISIAQVVLGTSVGARFAGLTFAKTGKTILLAAIATVGMLILSGIGAMLLGPLIGVDPLALLLALAPGGVTEMSLIALALDQDIAFVTTHHVVRIALIVMIGPAVFVAMERLRTRSALTTETRE
jgi:uncharacterized protein